MDRKYHYTTTRTIPSEHYWHKPEMNSDSDFGTSTNDYPFEEVPDAPSRWFGASDQRHYVSQESI